MATTINNFLSAIKGGARPSLFKVEVNFPDGISTDPDIANKLIFFVKGAQLPGINNGTVSTFFRGREIPLAGDRTFDELTLTVVNDNDFAIRKAFELWCNFINGHNANTGAVLPSEYMADVVISQLNRQEETIKSYRLIGAFPTNVAPIDLSMDATDQIEEFTVSLRYAYWVDEENGIE